MGNYGIGYKGSKNKIADKIINLFPNANNFYDLFAGGCSITHAALLSNKYINLFCNDINPGIINLFNGSIHGKYTTKNKTAWISKEDFFKLKENDPYIYYCWSFGNTGRTYLYSEEIEPYKKALHYAILFLDYSLLNVYFPSVDFNFLSHEPTPNKRRLALQNYFKNSGEDILENFTRLQSLERLESLERLNNLESLERLNYLSLDYSEIEIKQNSVIYCDIPYKDTDGYNGQEFDFERFYKWAAEQKEILFISSYEMPADQFITVAEIPHVCTLSHETHAPVIERVFIPKHQAKLYEALRPQPLLFNDMIF